jgi:hypothetical protein
MNDALDVSTLSEAPPALAVASSPSPQPKPGDTLFWQSTRTPYGKPRMELAWEPTSVTVGKCGRKWAEVVRPTSFTSYGTSHIFRMDLNTLEIETEHAKCYRSEAEWRAEQAQIKVEKETDRMWDKLRREIQWIRRPKHLTAEAIRQVAAILRIPMDETKP